MSAERCCIAVIVAQKIAIERMRAVLDHAHRAFTRRELLHHLWDSAHIGYDRSVDVHVANIRRKLGEGEEPARLVTVRGVGYRLVPV